MTLLQFEVTSLLKRLMQQIEATRDLRELVDHLEEALHCEGVAIHRLTRPEKLERYRQRKAEALVDFDSTLCEWAYPLMGNPTEGAQEAMEELHDQGWRIVIWTARMDRSIYPLSERLQTKQDIEEWCAEHGIRYDEIDIGNFGKRVAGICIDDKNIHFCGDWGDVLRSAKALRELDNEKFEETEEKTRGGNWDRSWAQGNWDMSCGLDWEDCGGSDYQGRAG